MHVTKDGQEIPLSKLEDSHLLNIINLIKRRAKEGITLRTGGGCDAEDYYYEEEELTGKQVKEYYDYKKYKKEFKRRKKLRGGNY